MSHVDEWLAELALGTLADEERAPLVAHLDGCATCRAEVERTRAAFAGLAFGAGAIHPRRELRERLFADVRGEKRFWPFLDRVARLFDLPALEVQGLLAKLDDESVWTPDENVPGLSVFLLNPGPRVQAVLAGFGRFATGSHYPRHKHLGEEEFLVLQGGLTFDDGSLGDPGDDLTGIVGTAHSFDVRPGPACIAAVVLHGAIEFLGS